MSKPILWLATACAVAALAACTKPDGESTAAPGSTSTSTTVATVNGKKLSSDLLEVLSQAATGKPISEATPEQKQQLVDQLINMSLASQEADKQGLANSPEVKARLELLRMQILAGAASDKFDADNPVTDADVRSEYVAQVAAMPKEYKARHILVETKEIGESLIRDLNSGSDFAKLAASESKDAGSAAGGGELGWFTLDRMVKPFSDAVSTLEKGQVTAEPVQSEFGWHVIQLEDTRSLEAPDFEEVKDRVRILVQRKRYQAHLDQIRQAGNVQNP
jgi:peptidyl-prolyl cis-trans isomerase C